MPINKILIITDALTQPLYHPRVRNLYSYLKAKGIEIDWITEKYESIPNEFDIKITTIPFYKHKGYIGKIDWIIKNILNLLFDYKNRYFAKKILIKTQNKKYDLVFCSTFHTFGLKAAYTIAKTKKIPLHIDLRDIAEQCKENEYSQNKNRVSLKIIDKYYRTINIKRRNIILRKADCITSVSPWHVEYIKHINPNTHLIYNGYNIDKFYPKQIKANHFDIIYTGKWYGKTLQDPELLFKALQTITNKNIRLVWYTNENIHKEIKEQIIKYNIKIPVLINKYIPNSEIPQKLNESSIILVLTNKGNHGIMTTKFFEALGVEKPILCVRSDEECLAKVIEETRSGLAATNVEEVKAFIIKYYNEWLKNGYTHIDINNKEQFTRQNQAKQFVEIFNTLTKVQ